MKKPGRVQEKTRPGLLFSAVSAGEEIWFIEVWFAAELEAAPEVEPAAEFAVLQREQEPARVWPRP